MTSVAPWWWLNLLIRLDMWKSSPSFTALYVSLCSCKLRGQQDIRRRGGVELQPSVYVPVLNTTTPKQTFKILLPHLCSVNFTFTSDTLYLYLCKTSSRITYKEKFEHVYDDMLIHFPWHSYIYPRAINYTITMYIHVHEQICIYYV